MKPKSYTVIVILKSKTGSEHELKTALQSVVEPSRSEPTCLEYRLHHDQNDRSKFVLYEHWESKEAHQRQFEKPYILAFIEKTKDLFAEPYEAIFAEEI